MKSLNPYPNNVVQFHLGLAEASVSKAFILRKEMVVGPVLYFVKDIHYTPPWEYWSAVQAMAKRFGLFNLALDFMRYLELKPRDADNPEGPVTIITIEHRETKPTRPWENLAKELNIQGPVRKDSLSLIEWLTTYTGVTGPKKAEEEVRIYRPPQDRSVDALTRKINERYARVLHKERIRKQYDGDFIYK